MPIQNMEIKYASTANLYLDPLNPRIGRHNMGYNVPQEKILDLVSDWVLDELALSYLENDGFWVQEALFVVEEELYGENKLVVIEGNRRLAALKFLEATYNGNPPSKKWEDMIKEIPTFPPNLFTKVPYILIKNRKEIQTFLAFRHVTGIKQWNADEKAFFIAKLIDEDGMSYAEVMRRIGSKTPTIRRHYIAYRVLLQIEAHVDDYNTSRARQSFTILYSAIDTTNVKKFLNINISIDEIVKNPVPASHLENLKYFAKWLYGNNKGTYQPLVTNPHDIPKLDKVLKNDDAISYLKRSPQASLDIALQLAQNDDEEIALYINQSADSIELALSRIQHFTDSSIVKKAVERLSVDFNALINNFPDMKNK